MKFCKYFCKLSTLYIFRPISDGYLPAVEDDYDNLSDYQPSGRGSGAGQAGYRPQGRDQPQYKEEEEEATTAAAEYEYDDYSGDYEDGSGSGDSAGDQYAAPSNTRNTFAPAVEADGGYGAPGGEAEGSGADQSGVTAAARSPDTDYSVPGAAASASAGSGDYEAPGHETGNGFPFEAVESRRRQQQPAATAGSRPRQSAGSRQSSSGSGSRQCPGGSIEQCVSVCPGNSVRVYGACVGGCADRCPGRRV